MNGFVYLPACDRVIFLNHIQQIEVFRENSEVKGLGIYTSNNPIPIANQEDIKVLCNYFMIPLIKQED